MLLGPSFSKAQIALGKLYCFTIRRKCGVVCSWLCHCVLVACHMRQDIGLLMVRGLCWIVVRFFRMCSNTKGVLFISSFTFKFWVEYMLCPNPVFSISCITGNTLKQHRLCISCRGGAYSYYSSHMWYICSTFTEVKAHHTVYMRGRL